MYLEGHSATSLGVAVACEHCEMTTLILAMFSMNYRPVNSANQSDNNVAVFAAHTLTLKHGESLQLIYSK
ncbi:MAG: hypothetical protein AMXMBFR84_09050 [Candidatus Hydrogenedentota bacterium]